MAESFTFQELGDSLKAADASYPRKMYKPGFKEVTVYTAAELAALGAGWSTKVISV